MHFLIKLSTTLACLLFLSSSYAEELNLNYNHDRSGDRSGDRSYQNQTNSSDSFRSMGADGKKNMQDASERNRRRAEQKGQGKGEGKGKGKGNGKGGGQGGGQGGGRGKGRNSQSM